MSETDEWRAKRARLDAFTKAELGKLYRQHERALIDYWRRDADDTVSPSRLKDLDERCREATQAFVAELMKISGV
jgi:hypothetical protein